MNNLDNKDHRKIIPKGPYCYFGSRNPSDKSYKPCPYWSLRGADRDGYCSFLEIGDHDPNGSLCLWDQVKECGINCDYED